MAFRHVLAPVVWMLFVLLGAGAVHAQIPQDHDYQVTLRTYLETLTEADFEVTLEPVVYEDSFFTSMDQLHATWILLEDFGRQSTLDMTGVRVDASYFVLSSIEQNGEVYMRAGRNSGFLDPVNTAWWATWDYAGNPYFDSRAVKLRAFVASAVDMMMTDHELEGSIVNQRSDYVGGYLAKYGYAYYVAKDLLDVEVQEAYETGLLKFFERLESYQPYGSGGADMEAFQLPALWYTAEAIDSDDLRFRARERTLDVLQEIMRGDGHYHEHGNDGLDLSYEGILHHFLAWAALLYDDPEIDQFVDKSARLKAYQTLPEPSGHFFSPSHFNTGTAKGEANDQWHSYQRDHAMAMLSEEARYLIWTGRTLPAWYEQGVPSETVMRTQIAQSIIKRNDDTEATSIWAWMEPSANTPGVWRAEHWLRGLAAAAILYKPGFYAELEALEASNAPATKPPFLREENFIEEFGDTFVIARFDTYGAIIHTGSTVSQWGNGVPGLSGGSLSAFWTESTGSVIMGRSRGTQNADADEWSGDRGWDTWAVHAISGVNASGQPFSSARNRIPEVETTITGNEAATITVSGAIGQHDNGLSAPDQAIVGDVAYERVFSLKPSGLTVTSTLTSDESDQVTALWEMIPLFLVDTVQDEADASISLYVDGAWVPATDAVQEGVTAIRTTRFDESVKITFERPRRVKLSSTIWEASSVSSRIQNVMVDLLEQEGPAALPATASVTYAIRPADVYAVGDTSGDGLISAYDAAAILQHLINYQTLEPAGTVAADVSGDGTITAFDASLILQYIVGLVACMPAADGCQ
ncbi:MAG: dockerin type I repeat-containing protein [Bacteroidota bacterium]